VDFITAPLILSPQFRGNQFGAAFFEPAINFSIHCLMTCNSSAWVKKQARMRADFRGLFSPGAAKTLGANIP
jgi:hypothetical protein